MNITQGGLYELDASSTHIHIDSADPVALLDLRESHAIHRTIEVAGASHCSIYGYVCSNPGYSVHITCSGDRATSRLGYVLAGRDGDELTVKILAQLSASNSETDVRIVSIVADKSQIRLDGTVQIDRDITRASGHILEENIFLGSSGKIQGVPSLLVRSNDVAAGHAARIERISDEKLYYLRARGIPRDDATVMMLRSTIVQVFDGLEKYDEKLYESLIEEILGDILSEKNHTS